MAYDFNRPFVDSKQLPNYVATDIQEARLYGYGNTVRAVEMSNAEYSERFRKFSADRTMKPAPSHGRIFPGYLVVRKIDTKAEYETWMPDHVFEEIYVASSRQKSERKHDPAYVLHIDGAAEKALRSMRDKVGERTKVRVKNSA